MSPPDLNIDLGEHDDEPVELYRLAHRVNVACGGHAGDEQSMRRACRLARAAGALVGAHPSYEDRENFGRKAVSISPEELHHSVEKQCRALREIAAEQGLSIAHVKPHGALYHDAARDKRVAEAVVHAVRATLGVVPIIGSIKTDGLPHLREGFADRRYTAPGQLADRSRPDALITNPVDAAEQARRLARSGAYDTICVHSDTSGAVAIARAVREALDAL